MSWPWGVRAAKVVLLLTKEYIDENDTTVLPATVTNAHLDLKFRIFGAKSDGAFLGPGGGGYVNERENHAACLWNAGKVAKPSFRILQLMSIILSK